MPAVESLRDDSVSVTRKIDVAKELLNSALYHYYETGSYYSSLHLAGAAEEILGAYVARNGGESSFESIKNGTVRTAKILRGDGTHPKGKDIANMINLAKNSSKHMNKEEDELVSFSPKDAAKELLDRAITNYYYLMQYYPLEETAHISKFNSELVEINNAINRDK